MPLLTFNMNRAQTPGWHLASSACTTWQTKNCKHSQCTNSHWGWAKPLSIVQNCWCKGTFLHEGFVIEPIKCPRWRPACSSQNFLNRDGCTFSLRSRSHLSAVVFKHRDIYACSFQTRLWGLTKLMKSFVSAPRRDCVRLRYSVKLLYTHKALLTRYA